MTYLDDVFQGAQLLHRNNALSVSEILFLRHLELAAEGEAEEWLPNAKALIRKLRDDLEAEKSQQRNEVEALVREYRVKLTDIQTKSAGVVKDLKENIFFLEKMIAENKLNREEAARGLQQKIFRTDSAKKD